VGLQSVYIHLLGDFRLLDGDIPVTALHAPRLQALLAYLILHRAAPQPRRHLACCLWPESSEAQAQTNLRNLVYQLRHALPYADHLLRCDGPTLQWCADGPFTADVAAFEQALVEAEQAEHQGNSFAARAALETAVGYYQGDLLPSCYDEWILPERERLRQHFTSALEQLIMLLEAQRDYPAAIHYVQRLLQYEPLHEATYLQLMRLYALSGDRAAALHTYQSCAATLRRELGAQPAQPLRDAYVRLIEHDNDFTPSGEAGGLPALIGRQREWNRLLACWRSARSGPPHVVILSGEAGIGKTRLAEELLRWADQQGFSTARAQCYAAEGAMVYAPVVRWLRARRVRAALPSLSPIWLTEIARLAPEVLEVQPNLVQPGPLSELWQRQRLFESLARGVLAAPQPLLLLLDDLQWCDRPTLEWLRYLLHADPQAHFLLLGTLRTEEVAADHPLMEWLVMLRGQSLVSEILLEPLDEAETASLGAQVAGHWLSPEHADALYRETEGNPLFVVETVCMQHNGQQACASVESGDSGIAPGSRLPPRVQAVIAARLAKLSPLARDLASLAATIGRSFTFALLARASDLDEDALLRGLDELWRRRIIREKGEQGYDFSHDKLREVADAELSTARRRMLHRRIARALEGVYANQIDAISPQLATHYEQASCPEPAIRAYQRAAEAAQRVYAFAESLSYCRRALALLHAAAPDQLAPKTARELVVRLQERMGNVLALAERHDQAREAYARALKRTYEDDALTIARLHRLMGNTWRAQALFTNAEGAYASAREALEHAPAGEDVDYWREWIALRLEQIEAATWQGLVDAMSSGMHGNTQAAIERYGTPAQRARFLLFRLTLASQSQCGRADDITLASLERILRDSDLTADRNLIALVRWGTGVSLLICGDLERADTYLRAGLELAEESGNVQVQARSLVCLGILARRRQQINVVQNCAARTLALATTYHLGDCLGAAHADLACVAWRAGDLCQAAEHGQRAIEHWRQSPIMYLMQWTALLPLLAVASAQNQIAEAITHTQALLAPPQQRLPEELAAALVTATRAFEAGEIVLAREHLQRAVTVAQKLGFL
jgi:DNA-binding SARP family transcriptional activator